MFIQLKFYKKKKIIIFTETTFEVSDILKNIHKKV